jgi:PleD family two-component response regulator
VVRAYFASDGFDMLENSVLLIDPFKNLLNAYGMIFEEEKYSFETVSTLAEACPLLRTKRYSVILIEYFPPYETTDEIIRWLKKNLPETYIVMVTDAMIDAAVHEKLFAVGLDDLIVKPCSPERVLVYIRKGLRFRERNRQIRDQLILDPVTHQIQQFIFNSSYFKNCLRREIKRARRHKHPFSMLLIRIPGKEEVAGSFETIYAELARLLRKYVREEDVVGRENGHFGILLPDTDQDGSQALTKRLSNLIRNNPVLKAEKGLSAVFQDVSFHAFTYPDMSFAPETLKRVVDDVNMEPPRR